MLFDIHTAMQNTDNFDLAFSHMAVKNNMFADTIFEISFPDVIARTANIGIDHQIMKRAIKLRQIANLLGLSPLLTRITANGKQIVHGFLRKDK